MASLTTNDKQLLEKLLQMGGGYVLNFSDRTMGEFFNDDVGINIYDEKYNYASGSKANRIRGFWQVAGDSLVGKSIVKLVEYIENQILIENLQQNDFPQNLIDKGKKISDRLLGKQTQKKNIAEDEFLKKEFSEVSIGSLKLDGIITGILEQRLEEIKKCLNSKAALATIFLCGSTLEGILLGVATSNPQKFNVAKTSPKDKNGKVLQFHEWTLSNFIDVAKEIGFLKEDVKKFSHSLRDFRNYIHPYQQANQQFNPDEHTAKLCWQVLKVAIFQITNK
ncbi:MAG: hypothetical protein ISS45_11670 [Candidatus Omnitrophica bacterium]|nr:hypothetical protein [Candidatus Omnitrophota bacterium]